jgi:hypothetical protein
VRRNAVDDRLRHSAKKTHEPRRVSQNGGVLHWDWNPAMQLKMKTRTMGRGATRCPARQCSKKAIMEPPMTKTINPTLSMQCVQEPHRGCLLSAAVDGYREKGLNTMRRIQARGLFLTLTIRSTAARVMQPPVRGRSAQRDCASTPAHTPAFGGEIR